MAKQLKMDFLSLKRGERAGHNQGTSGKNGPAEEPSGNLGAPAWIEQGSKYMDGGN